MCSLLAHVEHIHAARHPCVAKEKVIYKEDRPTGGGAGRGAGVVEPSRSCNPGIRRLSSSGLRTVRAGSKWFAARVSSCPRCCAIRKGKAARFPGAMTRREDSPWDFASDGRLMRQSSPSYAANKDSQTLRGQQPLQDEGDIESPSFQGEDLDGSEAVDLLGPEKKPSKRKLTLFGVELSPDIVAISMVYFVQGILGLSRLAVSFFLKDDLHLSPAETALLSGVSAFPWLVKPIYGFVSDGLPLFGYRRRSYLVLCGFLGAVAWGGLAFLVDSKYTALVAIFLSSLSVAFSDVVVDSMVVERARGESQGTAGSLQSLCWGSSATGGIVSAYFSGYLVESYGVRFVFGVTALLPLITSAVAGLVQEQSVYASGTMGNAGSKWASGVVDLARVQMGHLWRTAKEPNIFLPTLFIFLWQATPTSDTAMFYFTTNKLGFGPEFLGRVRLVTSVASLVGVGVYNGWLKHVSLQKMFFWTTVVGAVLGLTQLLLVTGANRALGISDQWFAMGDSLILTVLGQVSFMPILVLAARLCPPGVEATLFATLMSISNGAGVTGGLMGAGLTQMLGVTSTNFDHLLLLLIICNVSSLLPLPFLGLLPSESDLAAAVEKADKALLDMEESKQL